METQANYDAGTDGTLQVRDARTERRFFVDNVIIRGYGKALGVYGVAVYSALCMHAKLATQQGYPSHSTIAELLDCSASKVKGSIRLLEKLKLIHSEPRYDKKTHRQTSNLYTLLAPPVPPVITDTPPRNAEKATNNPPLDQSYLKEEPALPDSPSAEDSPDDDPDVAFVIAETPEIVAFWAEGELPPPTSPQEAAEQRHARMCDELGTDPLQIAAVVEKKREEVAHPDMPDASRDGGAWVDEAVLEWCVIAKKSYLEMTPPTKLKLAGIFRKVGAITNSGAVPVAAAIQRFPHEHKWWAEKVGFEWPSDNFCNKLAMMLVPDIEPEPQLEFTFVKPDWLEVWP